MERVRRARGGGRRPSPLFVRDPAGERRCALVTSFILVVYTEYFAVRFGGPGNFTENFCALCVCWAKNIPQRERETSGHARHTEMSGERTPPLQIQLLSDLHLEFRSEFPDIEPAAPYLALLGDIGYARADGEGAKLSAFLRATSPKFERIFLLKGNHELYGTSRGQAVAWLRNLEIEIPNVTFLDRDYVDVETSRILGCTLWSRIPKSLRKSAWSLMSDFDEINDLRVEDRTAGDQNAAEVLNRRVQGECDAYDAWYCEDVDWLNAELERARVDVERGLISSVVILTHHAPLVKEDAVCEKSRTLGAHLVGCEGTNLYNAMLDKPDPVVKAWCYGHTHKCFCMRHGEEGTLIVSNPMGNPEDMAEGEFCACCVISISPSEAAQKVCRCSESHGS